MQVISKNNSNLILVLSSILIVMFLFYIDEGYYNFKWMLHIGNWFAFLVYFSFILGAQLLLSWLLQKIYRGPGRTVISAVGGAVIGVLVVIYFVFTKW